MIPLIRYSRIALIILKTDGFRALIKRIIRKLFSSSQAIQLRNPHYSLEPRYYPLSFPDYSDPEISIIIPLYNKSLYTFTCLKSIHENSGKNRYKVIVIDDASDDDTAVMLEDIEGITVIRNTENKGFIFSSNVGAKAAKGRYIVLLNNDTIVTTGWLDALRNTFMDFPDAGLVGAKLIYPDGRLQEAGGIVWQDASAVIYGRYDDPNKPEYSYCREVDYCSGACLMIPRQDFLKLGLFDDYYTPAYYEDTDLAFRVRKNEKKFTTNPAQLLYISRAYHLALTYHEAQSNFKSSIKKNFSIAGRTHSNPIAPMASGYSLKKNATSINACSSLIRLSPCLTTIPVRCACLTCCRFSSV